MKPLGILLIVLLVNVCVYADDNLSPDLSSPGSEAEKRHKATIKRPKTRPRHQKTGKSITLTNLSPEQNKKIKYHEDPIMKDGVNLYLILYGLWTQDQVTILQKFLGGLKGSPWYDIIVSKYYSGTARTKMSGEINLVTTYMDADSLNISAKTTKIISTEADFQQIIQNAINGNNVADDPDNGLYLTYQ